MYRILMIDDDPDMIDLTKLILKREGGFELIGAYCGEEGLRILQEEDDIDLILLDIMMVGMDGWEVLESLRHDSRRTHIPVIIVTAHHYFVKERPGVFDEVVDFVLKPFLVTDFVNKIRNAVRYQFVLV